MLYPTELRARKPHGTPYAERRTPNAPPESALGRRRDISGRFRGVECQASDSTHVQLGTLGRKTGLASARGAVEYDAVASAQRVSRDSPDTADLQDGRLLRTRSQARDSAFPRANTPESSRTQASSVKLICPAACLLPSTMWRPSSSRPTRRRTRTARPRFRAPHSECERRTAATRAVHRLRKRREPVARARRGPFPGVRHPGGDGGDARPSCSTAAHGKSHPRCRSLLRLEAFAATFRYSGLSPPRLSLCACWLEPLSETARKAY